VTILAEQRTYVAGRWVTGDDAVNVNTTVFSAYAPSGGYKQSGLGRERGPDGIREFQEVKHMSIGELK
jgi:aldehyde dehydrogenase (NAD+)